MSGPDDRAADIAAIRAIVADVEAGFNANDAELMNRHVGHAMVALYVLTQDEGRWWIRARQNTLVPS